LEFTVKQALNHMWHNLPFFFLGVLLGIAGTAYNNLTIASLHLSDRFSRVPSVYRAAAIGAIIGLVAWFKPELVGGGGRLTQTVLAKGHTVEALLAIFCLRFILGPLSYAAGTPGGLFTPIMLLGASFGAFFALTLNFLIPSLGLSVIACAVVGMGALFTASIQAPLTGIVIVIEMTGRVDLSLALIAASVGAMIVVLLLKSEPIYDRLKRRMLQQQIQASLPHTQKKGWLSDAPRQKSKVQ
jgi:CIC family chloride channel protein